MKHLLNKFFLSLLIGLSGCSPKEDQSTQAALPQVSKTLQAKDSVNGEKTDEKIFADPRKSFRKSKISRFEIDDPSFNIYGIAVGFKDFMNSQSPHLTYKLPKEADYTEIIRCRADANIKTATSVVALEDIALNYSSVSDKAAEFRKNDFFRAAEETKGCEVISLGTIGSEYLDSYASSGTYRYLIRACVAKERLIDVEKLTTRACSQQVGVSDEWTYTNTRKEQEQQALRKRYVYESQLDNVFWNMRLLAEDFIAELNYCEERERKRAIDTKIKEAWVTLAATAADVAIEFKTAQAEQPGFKGLIMHYGQPWKNKMDTFQLIAAMGGLSFRDMFINLSASSSDMPRSCARLQSLQMNMQAHLSSLSETVQWMMYWANVAETAAQGIDVTDGQAIELPPGGFGF